MPATGASDGLTGYRRLPVRRVAIPSTEKLFLFDNYRWPPISRLKPDTQTHTRDKSLLHLIKHNGQPYTR